MQRFTTEPILQVLLVIIMFNGINEYTHITQWEAERKSCEVAIGKFCDTARLHKLPTMVILGADPSMWSCRFVVFRLSMHTPTPRGVCSPAHVSFENEMIFAPIPSTSFNVLSFSRLARFLAAPTLAWESFSSRGYLRAFARGFVCSRLWGTPLFPRI